MDERHVGDSGLTLSVLGLGCNNFGMKIGEDEATAVVHRALDEGVTHFDTAESYGDGRSEEMLGAALGSRRDEAVIATKFGGLRGPAVGPRGGRRNVVRACDDSLRRLGTDHIDLWYLHRPDESTPVEETLDAMSDLVRAGKVRYLACSAMPGWQVVDADHVARGRGHQRFVADQVEWSLLSRAVEEDVVPACRHVGVGVVPYFPLASGLLTGKYQRGEAFPDGSRFAELPRLAGVATDDNFERADRLAAFAAEHGHSLLELAICWLLSHDTVPSVLAGATSADQVTANVAAATSWRLDADELAAVDALLAGDGGQP